MAFSSFGNPSMGGALGSGAGGVQKGAAIDEIQTEALGFIALAGESKVRITAPWPADQLPPSTSSLISIASKKGLFAAAGPNEIVLAYTKAVREAYQSSEQGEDNVKPFQPQLRLPMPMRVSQVAFSADESWLVLSAETGGGLAVYDVQALMTGSTEPKFQIPTNSQALRSLVPNPTPEKGELFAAVTVEGNLLMANLKEQTFVPGPNGPILKDGVHCVSWSTRGKQLVAGLRDGSAFQMTPEGVGKGEIPQPPGLENNPFLTSITWLENNVFLMIHTQQEPTGGFDLPESHYHFVTRTPGTSPSFLFQKIETDPSGPFSSLVRPNPYQHVLRLRNFPPNIDDILVVASTASTDIGILTKANAPLSKSKPVTGSYTFSEIADDTKRAALPMSGMDDTSAIGIGVDLSPTEPVYKPIPGDEIIEKSSTPLPALMVLNNLGVLSAWWFVYMDSIRQGTMYSGLVAAPQSTPAVQSSPAPTQQNSLFGTPAPQPAFGSSAFGASAPSGAFGSAPQQTPAFGAPSVPTAGGAFGATSGLGQKASVWGTPASPATSTSAAPQGGAFGAPAFGTSSTLGGGTTFGKPSFGSPSAPGGLGAKLSPWSTGSTAPNAAFGQTGGAVTASPFGSAASTAPTSGGFSSFASKGGFAAASSLQNATSGGESIFSKPAVSNGAFGAPSNNAFGASNTTQTSVFGAPSSNTPFGSALQTENKPATGLFGSSAQTENKPSSGIFGGSTPQPTSNVFGSTGGFTLGTTFKADPSAKDNEPATEGTGSSFFGSNFNNALGQASSQPAPPVSKEADMDAPKPESTTPSSTPAPNRFLSTQANRPGSPLKESTTPASTPAPPKFPASSSGGLFGSTPTSTSTVTKPASAGFSFGKPATEGSYSFANLGNNTNTISPGPKTPNLTAPPSITETPATPRIKTEPESDEKSSGIQDQIPAPLPPDSTSKTCFSVGDSSSSSSEADEQTPPGTILKPKPTISVPPAESPPKPISADLIPPSDVPGGPEEEDDEADFLSEEGEIQSDSEEGSGEDVAKDLSPVSEKTQNLGFTPESSFGGGLKINKNVESFTNISRPGTSSRPSLFGEVAPSLPPPKPKNLPQSPRSPSPVRSALPGRLMGRPDPSRSVSAPGVASQILGSSQRFGAKPSAPGQSTFALTKEEQKAEEKRRADARERKEAEETQALIDEEDEEMQRFLAEEIKPTTTLDEFVAYTNYKSEADMNSVPSQVEAIYRDINSMIDTLGINAKALKAFILGHEEHYKQGGRTKEDLEDEEDWCLVELDDLSKLMEDDLARELQDGRIKDVANKLETCSELQKDLIKLHAKHEDVRKIIQAHTDPEQVAMTFNKPLSAEQTVQQRDLKRDFTKFQKLLCEAEESLTVLKAKLVSHSASNGRANGTAPTVEAVMRTITKMTGMAEKRSGDIDVLEGQMRKLRFSSVDLSQSREGSPFATPQPKRQSLRLGTPGTYGLAYTPERDTPRHLQSSFRSSIGSRGSPSPRKKLSGYSSDDKDKLKAKLARRQEVVNRLKKALEEAGTSVKLLEDDE
ncbi:hypothetical protein HYFRA_00002641 [Hymenoscyphus fraxineus]|uniref:Nucleoporin Nup159/Nup146 N-terminal domain-containing protein n=1 Tax=Hymenoscyphus fraxineus TaxID=746836 RepID=A0A9N9LAN0_9HELO|nr:hypothetical protein HYFRA_00002641 [Hymenoscyphus fraxineus]